jgi:CubicO group peptidase (beta-lactamase class C family)
MNMLRFAATYLACALFAIVDSRADAVVPGSSVAVGSATFERAALVDAGVPPLLKARLIAGAGVAVIRGYHVIWTGYYGEQGPGVPASRSTLFNTASVAKSITAETVLRLVAQGKVGLDEPIAKYYVEPDLAGDARYGKLTPRLILKHQSGLLNWSYNYKDGKLAFVTEPGTRFGYSGAAFDILAKFLEKKLNADFETLVRSTVFDPIGMTSVSMSRRASIDARVTTPMNSAGAYEAPYTTTQRDWHHGSWSAASDLFVSIDDYAKFFISVMRGEGMTPSLTKERWRMQSSVAGAAEWQCVPTPSLTCPDPYGFGLGYLVFDYGATRLIWASGNDSGENALAYFTSSAPGDAVIVFVNGGNGFLATTDIMDLVNPQQKLAAYFRQVIDRSSQGKSSH